MVAGLLQIKYVFGNDYLVILVNSAIYLFWFYLGYYAKDVFGKKTKGENNNGNEWELQHPIPTKADYW